MTSARRLLMLSAVFFAFFVVGAIFANAPANEWVGLLRWEIGVCLGPDDGMLEVEDVNLLWTLARCAKNAAAWQLPEIERPSTLSVSGLIRSDRSTGAIN